MYSEDKSNLDQEKKDNCFEKKKKKDLARSCQEKKGKGGEVSQDLRNDIPAAING